MSGRTRANHERSIFVYRTCYAAYSWIRSPGGQCRKKWVYDKTRAEVHDKWIKLQSQARDGVVAITSFTVAEYMTYWLAEAVRLNRAQLTYRTYVRQPARGGSSATSGQLRETGPSTALTTLSPDVCLRRTCGLTSRGARCRRPVAPLVVHRSSVIREVVHSRACGPRRHPRRRGRSGRCGDKPLTCIGKVADHITDKVANHSNNVADISDNVADQNPHQYHRHQAWHGTPSPAGCGEG